MKKIPLLLIISLAFPTTATAAEEASGPLTMADCYRLALKQSEQIAIRQELIAEAEARFSRALSGILPRASFSSSDKRQDGSGESAFTLRHVPERKFLFSQPLFGGFKEFSAMAATRAEGRQRILEKKRAEQLLLLDVADAFYLLLEQREKSDILKRTHSTLQERIKDLQQREQIGRSRRSEVVGAEAQMRRAEADLELAQRDETVARQLLEFLTGLERIRDISDTGPATPEAEPEEAYLMKASSRYDVKASEEAFVVSEKQVAVAKSGRLPTVGLDGNYYVERAGVSKQVDWDVALKVDVPIFSGGEISGEVKEAASKAAQAKLRMSEAGRKALREIREAYARFQAGISRMNTLAKLLEASEESYSLQLEDYRRSLINNLDVLLSLEDLENARRDFSEAKYDAKRLYWQLKVASGEIL